MLPPTLEWKKGVLRLIDQRALPDRLEFMDCSTVAEVAHAIRTLAVRGAPAIGIAAAYGVVIAAVRGVPLDDAIGELAATRPTAVNLFWALERMKRAASLDGSPEALLAEAEAIHREDIENNRRIGEHGQTLLPDDCTILTHCNAGALATGAHGTALGVVRSAVAAGKRVKVYADETRPVLQGARLTSWELHSDGIDVTVICDSMAGWLMKRRSIDAVIVGADRIAKNGDAANKIGTYSLAVLADYHQVPFYVAAPSSTIDPATPTGEDIPIEERDGAEIRLLPGGRVPDDISVWNPAFDVTPSGLIAAIISERGIFKAPYSF